MAHGNPTDYQIKVEMIAKVCHEANKAYCETHGDTSQPSWDDAPDWQIESAKNGVDFKLQNPDVSPRDSHESWMKEKQETGWVYGEVKDPEKKTHPCMVDYAELPEFQRKKDLLFISIVNALR